MNATLVVHEEEEEAFSRVRNMRGKGRRRRGSVKGISVIIYPPKSVMGLLSFFFPLPKWPFWSR